MPCDSASKKEEKEVVPSVTTCRNLEDIMLSEISHTQKDKCCMLSFARDAIL